MGGPLTARTLNSSAGTSVFICGTINLTQTWVRGRMQMTQDWVICVHPHNTVTHAGAELFTVRTSAGTSVFIVGTYTTVPCGTGCIRPADPFGSGYAL